MPGARFKPTQESISDLTMPDLLRVNGPPKSGEMESSSRETRFTVSVAIDGNRACRLNFGKHMFRPYIYQAVSVSKLKGAIRLYTSTVCLA